MEKEIEKLCFSNPYLTSDISDNENRIMQAQKDFDYIINKYGEKGLAYINKRYGEQNAL